MSTTSAWPPSPALLTATSKPAVVAGRLVVEVLDLGIVGDVAGHGERSCPGQLAQGVGGLPRRRSWASETTTVAPSSMQRRAVAKPMPVPAAAVMTTTLPSRSPWPAGGVGGPSAALTGSGPFGFARQSEHPLTDDVALDLVRAPVDGLGPAEEEGALPVVELAVGPGDDLAAQSADVHGQLS